VLENIEWWQWLFGISAAFFVGVAKTGVPGLILLAVPLMATSVGHAKASVPVLLPLLVLADIFGVGKYHKQAQWHRLVPLFLPLAVGMTMGAVVIKFLPEQVFKIFIGAIAIIMLAIHCWRQMMDQKKIPEGLLFKIFIGTVAGLATTAANAAGPVMGIYLISMKMEKKHFMGTAVCFFFMVNIIKIPIYGFSGLFSKSGLIFDLFLVLPVFAGVIAGFIIFKKIPQKAFDRVVLFLTFIASARLLISGIMML
jgi:uncharacterized protein